MTTAAVDHTNHRGWTDKDNTRWGLPPNVMVTAEDIAAAKDPVTISDDAYTAGVRREVYYVDSSGNKNIYELVAFVMPTGASAVTLYSGGASQVKGKLMKVDGTVIAAAEERNDDVVGAFFTDYYYRHSDGEIDFHATSLTEGDLIWLVTKGRMEMITSGTFSINDNLTTGSNGGVRVADAIGSEPDQHHFLGGKAIAIAREASTGTGEYREVDLHIMPKWEKP